MAKRISIQWKHGQEPKKVELVMSQELGLTRHQIRSAKFRRDGIRIDGKQVRVCEYLNQGEILEILLESERMEPPAISKNAGMAEILYEDEDLLIVNKPSGVVVHPSHGHYGDTLADCLQAYLLQKGERTVIRPIGRLDKDTSGAVLFAKNQVAAARLWTQFASEKKEVQGTHKEYLALVWGALEDKAGVIEAPIVKCPGELNRMQVSPTGREARTNYQALHHFIRGKCCFSLVRFRLETGRTHQIRVHMAYIGHPLLGDPVYGRGLRGTEKPGGTERSGEAGASGETERSGEAGALGETEKLNGPGTQGEADRFDRAALHCESIWLKQPFTGEHILAVAPLAQDMRDWIGEEYDINDTMLY